MTAAKLTRHRIANLFRLCGASPLRFSRAADRVLQVAKRSGRTDLWDLSDALHEQRHVARELAFGRLAEAAQHSVTVGICIERALRG